MTSLILLSSLFVVAGAEIASASQCGQVNASGCHLAFRFEDPAKSGIYTDTGPHEAVINETITTVDLDPNGPRPIVEVEDADGHRDTNYGGQISIAICSDQLLCPSSTGTGKLSGTTTVTAVEGAASFTDLSIDTKGEYQLTATALTGTGIAPVTSGTFPIHADKCAPGETCTDSFQTLMSVSLTNGGNGTIALSAAIDGVDPRVPGGSGLTSCSTGTFTDPFFHAPAESTVDEVRATGVTTKLLVIRIEKAWRQAVVDKGTQSYRPCITALVQFTTWDSSPLTETAPGQFTGLGPDCSKTITYFCRAYVKSNKVGDVIEGISLPSGSIAGDPKVH